ncbi:energy transducer TonB family protein [Afifella pfennigii]|uniref:energy transducer TonB family protein n=1 Tax=Afifella pfennigii TaxID=209897 RepID=UPI00068D3991|nr:energy transducer TonB [Afifella pfennigii]
MRAERLRWSLAVGGAALLHLGVLLYFAHAAVSADGGGGRPEAVAGIAEATLLLPTSEDAPAVEELSEADTAEDAEEMRDFAELSEVAPRDLAPLTPVEVPAVAPDDVGQAREAEVPAEVAPEELSEVLMQETWTQAAPEETAPMPPVADPLQTVTEAIELEPLAETPMPRARPDEVPEEALAEYRRQKRQEARRIAEIQRAKAEARERRQTTARAAERKAASQRRKAASAGAVAGREGPRDPGPNRRALSSYNSRVYAHLARHKRFPPGARRNGTATVRFTLSASGNAQGLRLVAGSGDAALDEAAVAMVRRASPFPPIPAEVGRSSMTFTVPINFARR